MTCPVTGLTEEEKQHLKDSWKLMAGNTPQDAQEAGINLLLWMFDNIPNMRPRFNKFDASSPRTSLIADEMFLAHTQNVVVAVDTLVKLLDDPQKLEQKLQSTVKSHVHQDPPIGATYFEVFAEKFHIFLKAALGVTHESEEAKAWEKFLYALASLIKAEEEKLEAQKQAEVKKSKGKGCCIIL